MTLPSNMHLLCIGLNQRTAPLELRERLALATESWSQPPLSSVREWARLSTCGRLEFYCLEGPVEPAEAALTLLLAEMAGSAPELFRAHRYTLRGEEVARHLCRVAAGLESVVLGEAQILGQVNDAYATAVTTASAGPILKALFESAIRAGKRARTETAIGRHPASLSSLAIVLAQEVAGDLRRKQILLVGLGEMGALALKALQARGISQISLINRSRERAEALAGRGGYQVYDLAALPEAIAQADVVISAVETERPLLDAALLQPLSERRAGRPLVLLDLSMPRSIDPAAGQLPHHHLLGLDDLRSNLDSALAGRQAQVPFVEAIIEQEVAVWQAQLEALAVEPLISSLRQRAEAIRQQELARTLPHLGKLDDVALNHIHHLSRSLVNKLLHEPTTRLRQRAGAAQTDEYAAVVRDLFDLEK